MAELQIDVTFGPGSLRGALVAALLLGAASELASESVVMQTYYPAPSGVYGQMLTTGNTTLARDNTAACPNSICGVVIGWGAAVPSNATAKLAVMNGSLGINTTNPVAELDLEGSLNFGSVGSNDLRGITWNSGNAVSSGFLYGINREPGAWVYPYPDLKIDFHTGVKMKAHSNYGGVSIWEDYCDSGVDNCATGGSGNGSEISRFRTNAFGGSYIATRFAVGGTGGGSAPLDVQGDGVAIFRQPGARCHQLNYSINSGASCAGGEFITQQSGVMTRYVAATAGGSGSALCCTCPFGTTCPTLP